MHHTTVDRVFDLTDPDANRITNMSLDEARARVASGDARAVGEIEGSFAIVARRDRVVVMARSMDRPLRFFLAKRAEGPALVVADRIDAIAARLAEEGLGDQFHPSYTRMVPAYHVTEIELVGCPDPAPAYRRYFTPERDTLPPDPSTIGRRYVEALATEIGIWLDAIPEREPIGVAFSGGIDSGAVFLLTYHLLLRTGRNPSRLKAFSLSAGGGDDLPQAREFLDRLGLGLFLEPIEVDPDSLDPFETVEIIEDYKPLDVEAATMLLALARGIRARYPDWLHLADGDGGDENLKDYPLEEGAELTIRSVLSNPLLYQEGWGVGRLKHSATYSGGQSRSATRAWAPLRKLGFHGFSPFTATRVVEVAEAIPFVAMTDWDPERLYALKGDVVRAGIAQVTGLELPVFPKRRFQAGAAAADVFRHRFAHGEAEYRRAYLSRWEH